VARAARVYTAHDLSSDRGVKSPRRSSDGSRARRPVPVRAVLCCAVHAAAVPVHGGRWDWEVGRARPTSVRAAGCGSKGRRGRGRGAAGVESVLGPTRQSAACRAARVVRGGGGGLAGWLASGARGSSGALAFKAQRQVTGEGKGREGGLVGARLLFVSESPVQPGTATSCRRSVPGRGPSPTVNNVPDPSTAQTTALASRLAVAAAPTRPPTARRR
jgi:hypothetical protein